MPRQTWLSAGLLWLAVIAGVVLSLMEILGICTDACSETADFTIFGFNFDWFGLAIQAALVEIGR